MDAFARCLAVLALLACGGACAANAESVRSERAPLIQYRIADRAQEIALARSAAPPAISGEAEVLVLGEHAYETAVKGKNGFVCIVERAWANEFDNSEFWNPKVRGPICFNAAAARSVLPSYLRRTEWVLAGLTRAQAEERSRRAVASGVFGKPEVGAMCYMMSKGGYLGDEAHGPWHSHLMFYLPRVEASEWGANVPNGAVLGGPSKSEPVTVFLIPVAKWSDGTDTPAHL